MKYYSIFFSFLILSCFNIKGQIIENGGANSTSMAGLNVNNADVWSTNNNIGQLANIEKSSVSISVFQPFLLKDFSTANLAFGLVTNSGAFGFNYSNYGNEFLQVHNAGFGYSLSLGQQLQSGIKINYHYLNAGEYYNKKSVLSADFGLAAQLTRELNIGLSLKNPTLSKLDDFDNERIPTIMQFAAGYNFSQMLSIQAGVKKDMVYPLSFLAAIDYKPNEKISLKGGIGTKPTIAAFGFGILFNQLQLNIAAQVHQILGWSPDFSITYQFQ